MSDYSSFEEKLGFVNSFLHVLDMRAPDVARPLIEVMSGIMKKPTRRKIDTVYRDFLEWCRGLSVEDRIAISKRHKTTMGLSLDYFDTQRLEDLSRITARGILRSHDEWRFLEERVQELSGSSGHDEEIAQLNRLLSAYQGKNGSD